MHMKVSRLAIISIGLAAWFTAAFLPAVTVAAADAKTDAATPAPVYTAAETKEFKALAQATLDALAAGKQTEMVAKLTDLETAWDDHEKVLRPKNEATW